MIEPHEIEPDRGKVVVIAALAVAAIFLLSQVAYPPAPLKLIPTPDATPADGTPLKPKRLPFRRFQPFRKEYEDVSPPAEVPAARP